MDEREQAQLTERVTTAQDALVAHLEALSGTPAGDGAAPSALPGWTRGHLLTHIARNADGIRRVLEGVDRGEHWEQYAGGVPARNADIDAGAIRSWAELVDDVRTSAEAFASQLAGQRCWEGFGYNSRGEELPAAVGAFARWREVVIHHSDLGDPGFTVDDWPLDYVREELRRQTMQWAARRPMGSTDLPQAALAAPERLRLLWLLGRHDLDDVESNRGL